MLERIIRVTLLTIIVAVVWGQGTDVFHLPQGGPVHLLDTEGQEVAEFPAIGVALWQAEPGFTLLIDETYSPVGDAFPLVLGVERVTLRASGKPENTVIDADGASYALDIMADGVTIEGLTIRGAQEGGIRVIGAQDVRITRNIIRENGVGIQLIDSQRVTIIGNQIQGNGLGIELQDAHNNEISENHIAEHTRRGEFIVDKIRADLQTFLLFGAPSDFILLQVDQVVVQGGGVILSESHNNQIVSNELRSNGFGIGLVESRDNEIRENQIVENHNGDFRLRGLRLQFEIAVDPLLQVDELPVKNAGVGLGLWRSSGNKLIGNEVADNALGIVLSHSNTNELRVNILIGHNEITFPPVEGMNVEGVGLGIGLFGSQENRLIDNLMEDNFWGLVLHLSDRNEILQNSVVGSDEVTVFSVSEPEPYPLAQGFGVGIGLFQSHRNSLVGNNVRDGGLGLVLHNAEENEITANRLMNNSTLLSPLSIGGAQEFSGTGFGVLLINSYRNQVLVNDVRGSMIGLLLTNSEGNWIAGNKLIANSSFSIKQLSLGIVQAHLDGIGLGAGLFQSHDNELERNTITGSMVGLLVASSSRNYVHHNRIAGNHTFDVRPGLGIEEAWLLLINGGVNMLQFDSKKNRYEENKHD